MTIYFDYNATCKIRPESLAAMNAVLNNAPGNASSVHGPGRGARASIEQARDQIARAVSAASKQIIFNSGATEGNNTVLRFYAGQRILISATEHSSIYETGREMRVEIIPVHSNGVIDLTALEKMCGSGPAPALISVMWVNNETGVINPVADIARIAHACGAAFHIDAVQALGKIPVDFGASGADFMTISSHKIGGPQGVGAFIIGDGTTGACLPPPVLLTGGGQERRLRAGTENVAGIAGFGAAAEMLRTEDAVRAPSPRVRGEGRGEGDLISSPDTNAPLSNMPLTLTLSPQSGEREQTVPGPRFQSQIESILISARPDTVIFGADAPRVKNTTCFAVPGTDAQTMLMRLDLAGVYVSSGSACSSGKVRESHVLRAMGIAPELSRGALRISTGWATTQDEIDQFAQIWRNLIA